MNTLLNFLLLFSSLYPNLYNSEIISNVREELTNKSGIYLLICNTTGKIYLGSAINLRKRFNEHLNRSNSNLLLQNAIKKYGIENFTFIILEICHPEELIAFEQYYMDELKPTYNILHIAGSLKGFKHSEASRQLISVAKKNNLYSLGYIHSEESRKRISLAHIGQLPVNSIKVYIYSLDNVLIQEFLYMLEGQPSIRPSWSPPRDIITRG